MVSNSKYLLEVGGNYYFRLRAPKHIEGMYCGTYIKKILQKSALHKATILRKLSMQVFKQLEEEMIKKDNALTPIAQKLLPDLLGN